MRTVYRLSILDNIQNDNKICLIHRNPIQRCFSILFRIISWNFSVHAIHGSFHLLIHENLVQIMCKDYLFKANVRYRIPITLITMMEPNIIILSHKWKDGKFICRDAVYIRNVSWKFQSLQLETSFQSKHGHDLKDSDKLSYSESSKTDRFTLLKLRCKDYCKILIRTLSMLFLLTNTTLSR